MIIRELFSTPARFLRSAHLERDFDDVAALRDYILTPPIEESLGRVLEGLATGSRRRAWRVTGDYGSGKSSFALVLAQLLRDPSSTALAHVRRATGLHGTGRDAPRMLPILVTGSREGIVQAIAHGAIRALSGLEHPQVAPLIEEAEAVAVRSDGGGLVRLIERVTSFAVGLDMTGAVLIIDEMGKLLEHAALHSQREDVFILQRLAEMAARSGDKPLIVVGLLHHGFHAYAERLPAATRHEWEKVAERFQEIVFDQPLAHVAALVSGALGVKTTNLPRAVAASARLAAQAAERTGWFGSAEFPDPLRYYPVHPTVLPVMARFFGRFGQHERSLFSFLLSSEPFAMQAFADQPVSSGGWFRLADFYDYVRAVFGYRLAGSDPRSQWSRLIETMDGITGIDPLDLRVLKSVALLNVLDAEDLLPTDISLGAAVGEGGVGSALKRLAERRILHTRGSTHSYCLWPTTSVNLDAAYKAGEQALGPLGAVSPHLIPFLPTQPLQARRHYIETGTLRYFEVRYAFGEALREAVTAETTADGLVVVALCDDEVERAHALGVTATEGAEGRQDLIIAVPNPLAGLAGDLQEVRVWRWVLDHTPELAHDDYGAAEARRQLAVALSRLRARLDGFVSFGGGTSAIETHWIRAGDRVQVTAERGLLAALSAVCDDLFPDAPLIHNELLNRRQLSSAAAAARMRLVERMLGSADEPALGMDERKAPPERSMYLSVLAAGGLHREESGHYVLAAPPEQRDPLRLRPALSAVMVKLEDAGDHRVPIPALQDLLRARPYGVRDGVIPLLLAHTLAAHGHELAVYENGTFVQRFGAPEFLRMSKVPAAFEVQLCRIAGIRSEVFDRLVELVGATPAGRAPDVLDVVGPLCRFAADLPVYTRHAIDLQPVALRVRDALLSAREPGSLLFRDLPEACGYEAFTPGSASDGGAAKQFSEALRDVLGELRAAYPALLARLRLRVLAALELGPNADRAALSRAAQVALAIREPRLRSFALRLADSRLGEEAWTEALASVVLAKPPARWMPGDEARCGDELDVLGATFQRVRAIHFVSDAPAAAVKITLTQGDGSERERVVEIGEALESLGLDGLSGIREALPMDPRIRLAVLAELLRESLEAEKAAASHGSP